MYYQRLPALVNDQDSNWLTEKNPDAYVFGLCTEIGAFAKDDATFMAYDGRFKEALANVTQEDQITRWPILLTVFSMTGLSYEGRISFQLSKPLSALLAASRCSSSKATPP